MIDAYKGGRTAGAAELRRKFSENLLQVLEERGMTQTDLARRSGLSKDAISTYVRQRSIPTKDSLELIAKALEVEPARLVPKVTGDSKRSPITVTMEGADKMRVVVDAVLPVHVATQIIELINSAEAAA